MRLAKAQPSRRLTRPFQALQSMTARAILERAARGGVDPESPKAAAQGRRGAEKGDHPEDCNTCEGACRLGFDALRVGLKLRKSNPNEIARRRSLAYRRSTRAPM